MLDDLNDFRDLKGYRSTIEKDVISCMCHCLIYEKKPDFTKKEKYKKGFLSIVYFTYLFIFIPKLKG